MAVNSDFEKRDPITYSCGGCDNRWRGIRTCHCAACHRSLAGIGMFDRHRSGGKCADPANWTDARLVDGIWRGPEWDPATVFKRSA